MKYIETLREGEKVADIYFCKSKTSAVTKNGKQYDSIILQDKTGVLDAKIWEPNSLGIDEFEALDYIDVVGEVTMFNGAKQLNVKRVRRAKEGEYDEGEYLPVSEKNIDEMYKELTGFIPTINNIYLKKLLEQFFVENEDFKKSFKKNSAAKSVHHSFIGGLLEHTLSVTKLCNEYTKLYPLLNRDLLLTAAMFHDIGKTRELSKFPTNDYTDEGQLLGHIVIGYQMVSNGIDKINGFPVKLGNELKHCILAHHGELEYGSPKKPAIIEAVALNFADNTDAKMETMKELLTTIQPPEGQEWLGYNRFMESNIRKTSK
ncbi:MAG: HD domain-containing protein [Lachnospiraceae bacterium]|nr:HD domain-containing protein [Lachnospiraceae bacterium]